MKVLIALDESPYSDLVVDSIAARQWPAGTLFKIVTVLEPIEHASGKEIIREFSDTLASINQRRKAAARRHCRKVAKRINAEIQNVPVECLILEGAPRKEIVNAAGEWGADRIMMGAHGSDVCPRNLLGSVSRGVANHAPCTVEIVRGTPQRKKTNGKGASCGSSNKSEPLGKATA